VSRRRRYTNRRDHIHVLISASSVELAMISVERQWTSDTIYQRHGEASRCRRSSELREDRSSRQCKGVPNQPPESRPSTSLTRHPRSLNLTNGLEAEALMLGPAASVCFSVVFAKTSTCTRMQRCFPVRSDSSRGNCITI